MPEPDDYIGRTLTPPTIEVGKSKPKQAGKPGQPKSRFRLLARFWQHPATADLSHGAQAAWCYLWFLSGGKQTCFPSIKRIGVRLGCCRRHARRATRELERAGFISVIFGGTSKGKKLANVYKLTIPGGQKAETGAV